MNLLNFSKIVVDSQTYDRIINFSHTGIKILTPLLLLIILYLVLCKIMKNDETKKYIKQGFFINIGMLLSSLTIGFFGILISIIILKIISI